MPPLKTTIVAMVRRCLEGKGIAYGGECKNSASGRGPRAHIQGAGRGHCRVRVARSPGGSLPVVSRVCGRLLRPHAVCRVTHRPVGGGASDTAPPSIVAATAPDIP